jgi:hypothetical protein
MARRADLRLPEAQEPDCTRRMRATAARSTPCGARAVIRARMRRHCLVLALVLLAGDAGAASRVKLSMPRFSVPAGASAEGCFFVRLPGAEPIDVASWEIRNRGAAGGFATLHFVVYQYTGERLAEWAPDTGHLQLSRGCLDLGPPDRDARHIVAYGFQPVVRGALPPGVALRLAPVPDTPGGPPAGVGILLAANWSNATSRPQVARGKVLLRRPRAGTVKRLATFVAERTAEQGLVVPPGQIASTESSTAALNAARPAEPPLRDEWRPATAQCVVGLTGHFHKRTRLFAVDALDASGQPANPADGPTNAFEPGRRHLAVAIDYTDPGVRYFTLPRLVAPGEALHYGCWTDNGLGTAVRLGCEESPGMPPGTAAALGGPAKPCTVGGADSAECPATDPAYPGRVFTGTCGVANGVAGTRPDDEACALRLLAYEAAPGPTCDPSALPPLL